jgi:hypothetical protein
VIITEIYCKALRRRDLSGAVGARIDNSNQASKATDAAEKPKAEAVEANITNLVGVDAFFICRFILPLPYVPLIIQRFLRCLQPRLRVIFITLSRASSA